MSPDEWKQFKSVMQAKMARLSPWVHKTFATEGQRTAIINAWWELFEKIPLINAQRALGVFHGDPGLHEKVSAGDIPAHIAKLAYTFADRSTTTRGGPRCPHCLDGGWVEVWTAEATRLATYGKLTTRTPYATGAVLCDCPAGDRIQGEQHARFDEAKMFRMEWFDDEAGDRVLPSSAEPRQLKRFMQWIGTKTIPEAHDEFTQFA